MPSSLIIEVCEIENIIPHDNADKLEIAQIKGWYCITQKGVYKKGDKVIYAPPEAVIPTNLAESMNVKNYLRGGTRVKTIKLRGSYSEGLIIPMSYLNEDKPVGTDVAAELGIVKYTPPISPRSQHAGNGPVKKRLNDERFKKYTDIENFKNYSKLFTEDDIVVITEKIHGTSSRWGHFEDNSLWGKICKFFGKPRSVIRVGSHNVILNDPRKSKYFKNSVKNVYWEVALNYVERLPIGYQVFGEIYGHKVQWLEYDAPNCQKFLAFDVMKNGEYLSYPEFKWFCEEYCIPTVPELYRGKFNLEIIHELANDSSTLNPECIREGVVIRPEVETKNHKVGRVILKYISERYREYVDSKNKEDFTEEENDGN